MKSYEDLIIYKESFALALNVHKLSLMLPQHEKYELGSQIRRAAFSISLNIAEGYGRNSLNEFRRFLKMSLGSCNEAVVLIDAFLALGYFTGEICSQLKERYRILQAQIAKFILSIKSL